MIGVSQVYVDFWILASCEICALVLCDYWICIFYVAVDGFPHDQSRRLYINWKFGTLYRLRPKVANDLEQREILCRLERTCFIFIAGYLPTNATFMVDLSVVLRSIWVT